MINSASTWQHRWEKAKARCSFAFFHQYNARESFLRKINSPCYCLFFHSPVDTVIHKCRWMTLQQHTEWHNSWSLSQNDFVWNITGKKSTHCGKHSFSVQSNKSQRLFTIFFEDTIYTVGTARHTEYFNNIWYKLNSIKSRKVPDKERNNKTSFSNSYIVKNLQLLKSTGCTCF